MSFLVGCVAVVVAATLIALIFGGVSKAKKKADGTGASQSGTVEGTAATGATDADCTAGTVVVNDDDAQKTKEARRKARWPPDQCGLEDDADQWEKWEAPPRIKARLSECQLSAADQERCRKMLDLIFQIDTVQGRKVLFDPDDVIDMCDLVQPYLDSEPVLIEDLPFDISVVGDLHGQMYDFFRVFEGAEVDGKPGWECAKFIFLGNYVDRGRQSLEISMGLFCLKMLYPDRIFLLRGNHANINVKYGLYDDLKSRYLPDTAKILFTKLNLAFCYLSVAAIVGNVHFCVHGGISTRGFTRRQLRAIYKPIYQSTDDSLIHDMAWSEPATGLRGTCFNKERGTSFFFGFDALCTALDSMQVECLIRGSKMMTDGFSAKWYCCHTVFTATNYGGATNDGGICEIDEDGKILYRILPYDESYARWEEVLSKAEAADSKDPNEKTRYYDDVRAGDIFNVAM